MKNFLLTLSLLFSLLLSAQEVEQNKLKKSSRCSVSDIKRDWVLKDSLFQLNLGFRVQRVGYGKTEGESVVLSRRNQKNELKLDGFVYSPKFGYKVELGFLQEISELL
jgi:hypothetical protein